MTEQATPTEAGTTQDELEVELTPHQKWVRERIEELYKNIRVLQSSQLDAGQLERRLLRQETALADVMLKVDKIATWLKSRPWQKGGGQ